MDLISILTTLFQVSCKALITAESFKTQNYYEMLADICPEIESASAGCLNAKR